MDTINKTIVVNQWKNTSTVINWFTDIPNKGNSRFIKFNIVEFYPSITEKLLDKAIAYARSVNTITDDVLAIIKNSRKSLLFDHDYSWIKKGPTQCFTLLWGVMMAQKSF